MITKKDLKRLSGLTQQGLDYRLKQMKKAGIKIKPMYKQTDRAPIRIYSEEVAEQIVNWRGRKPGPKPGRKKGK